MPTKGSGPVLPLSQKGDKRGIFLLHQWHRKIPLNLPLPKGEINCRLLNRIAHHHLGERMTPSATLNWRWILDSLPN